VTQTVRGRLGSVVARAALSEKAHLLVGVHLLPTAPTQALGKFRVALTGHLLQVPSRHPVQHAHRCAETFGYSRRREIGEGAHGMDAQSTTRGHEVAPTQDLD
jgi:hypothetical protein